MPTQRIGPETPPLSSKSDGTPIPASQQLQTLLGVPEVGDSIPESMAAIRAIVSSLLERRDLPAQADGALRATYEAAGEALVLGLGDLDRQCSSTGQFCARATEVCSTAGVTVRFDVKGNPASVPFAADGQVPPANPQHLRHVTAARLHLKGVAQHEPHNAMYKRPPTEPATGIERLRCRPA